MRLLSVLSVVAFAVLSNCSPINGECSAATCPNGCCDVSGQCQPGSTTEACGVGASQCTQCQFGTVCRFGSCAPGVSGGGSGSSSGGGDASGGGSASTGGGTSETGGGTASNGGGSVSAGGGTASNGGGQAPTGGGSSAGGGSASNGGGTASTGGGSASGGGTGANGGGSAGDCRQLNNCRATESCDLGTGQCVCLANYRSCNGACAACPTAGVASTACSGAQCVAATCTANQRVCNGACTQCPTANVATTTCNASNQCIASTCSNGYRACNGTCVACPANATATACNPGGTACVATTCSAGFNACGGVCVPDTSATQCGASCTACPDVVGDNWSPVCRAGVCGQGCPAGQTLCKGDCQTGSCVWSTTTVATAANAVVSVATARNASQGILTYVNGTTQYIATFTSGSTVVAPTFFETVTTAKQNMIRVSAIGSLYTASSPSSPDFDLYAWSTNPNQRMVGSPESGTDENVFALDATDTGMAMLSNGTFNGVHESIWFSWPLIQVRRGTVRPDNSKVFNLSGHNNRKVGWVEGGVLKIATYSMATTSWTIVNETSRPPVIDLLRANPVDGSLANVKVVATGLSVELQSLNWAAVPLALPTGAVWRAKFDSGGIFHVVSSHTSTGTQLHTIQGNLFVTETVSSTAFGAVDFSVRDVDSVVGASPGVVLYR